MKTKQTLFRRRIRQRCAELNTTMAAASVKAGHTAQWMWSVSVSENPRTTTIHEVAKALDTTPSYFFVEQSNQQFDSIENGNGGDAA